MAPDRSRKQRNRDRTARPARNASSATPHAHPPRTVDPEGHRVVVGATLLRLGTAALAQALEFKTPTDTILRNFFRAHPKLGRRDRGVIAEGVYAVLRRFNSFRQLAPEPTPRRLFILGAKQYMGTPNDAPDMAISEAERGWLDALAAPSMHDVPLEVRAELPPWIVTTLRRTQTDDEILALGNGMQAPAPLDLRINLLTTTREDAIARLGAAGICAHATPHSPFGLRVDGKPPLEQHELFRSGAVEVQDEGSQLLGLLLAPKRREMVVDFCAGAGGKTLLFGAMMRSEGRLYAFDVSSPRLHRLRARITRSGLSNVQAEAVTSENDVRFKRLAGKIDRVFVDAPCTGLGTLRRNPDLKWRQQPDDLAELAGKQRRILAAAAKLLKPGGRLVYATCSILPDENDAVADDFLANHPDFRPLDCERLLAEQGVTLDCGERLRLVPHRHGTDGFFAAAFERVRKSAGGD